MIIADNKDIAHMILDNGFASIMTKLFKAVIKANVGSSRNDHVVKSIYMVTHFFILCTQNEVMVRLCFPQLIDFIETIFVQSDFVEHCTTDFFNSTNLGFGKGG